ncbi:LysE family translocator [Geminocystis sp. NIES-3709]|uniref:LysE family translocator n=1 Tax=Geminocystis sp. NIES-3709 TaxID=1617448 RepID=UPI0005FC4935|nr:LysE family translocator [Geminocystis sp. NIES-3709]BAQ65058.1 Mll4618 protein [Geminocystis sp. NIES-3709]
MTFSTTFTLFVTIVVLAFIPSISVLAVSLRSVTYGFTHGIFTTAGIVFGDIIFILLAIYGLSFLWESMGNLFILIKFLGGGYLIWLGISLWKSKPTTIYFEENKKSSFLSSFLIGFFISLGDFKAIFFYLSFLPAFVDLSTISIIDTAIIILTATLGVGSAKLSYALIGNKTSYILKRSNLIKKINMVAGIGIIGIGLFLVLKT